MACEGSRLTIARERESGVFAPGSASASVPEFVATAPATIDLGLSHLFRRSPANAPALRVGLLLDGDATIRCFRHVIEDVVASNFARLALVVVNAAARQRGAAPASRWERYRRALTRADARQRLAFSAYERFVDVDESPDDPTALVSCADLLAGVPRLAVQPLVSRFVHRFPDDALARLREHRLDVCLRFGFNILRGPVLGIARCGVWSYHHGDPEHYRGGPAHFWEMVERRNASGVILQVLTEELDAGLVLARGAYPTQPSLSLRANRRVPYWSSQHFVIQKLNEVHRLGWEHVHERAEPAPPYRGRRLPYRTPTNLDLAGWGTREVLRRGMRRLVRPRTLTDWAVALRPAAGPLPEAPAERPLAGFRFLPNPPDGFLADPFLLEHRGRTWLFVEELRHPVGRGVISVAELGADGTPGEFVVCLDRPCHLSYPHVFVHDGEAWMVPESEGSGAVDLYRAVDFPLRWQREATLVQLRAVDPTPFLHQGRWWMYVTHTAVPGFGINTLLYGADALHGPWRLHPAAAISTDVRRSRGAGAVFRHGDRLVRPSQDCAKHYGHALVLNEVLRLDEHDYAERPLRRFETEWPRRYDGVHHYHRAGGWETIDVRGQRRT